MDILTQCKASKDLSRLKFATETVSHQIDITHKLSTQVLSTVWKPGTFLL